jgi:hypothetical protein
MTIQKIINTGVDCKYKDCWSCGEWQEKSIWKRSTPIAHGDVALVLASGKYVLLPTKGHVRFIREEDEEGFMPQISPDKTLVGVTVGMHKKCEDWSVGGTMFVNSELHFYNTKGRRVSICKVPGTFIERWQYFGEGKQVIVASRWHHGATTYRLFDIKSGRERAKHMGMWEDKKTMPAWLKKIYEEI